MQTRDEQGSSAKLSEAQHLRSPAGEADSSVPNPRPWPRCQDIPPRVREVLDELAAEQQQPLSILRALAELYVAAERLSNWVAARDDAGISRSGSVAPVALEARRAWALYLEKARPYRLMSDSRLEPAVPADKRHTESQLDRHLRGKDGAWDSKSG